MSLMDESLFPATSEADWRARISTERDGTDLDAALKWIAEPGLILDAVSASLSNVEKPNAEVSGRLPEDAGHQERTWSILTADEELSDERTLVLDVSSIVSPIHSVVQQCAVAAATLQDQADGLGKATGIRVLVPVSHFLVLEVAKLKAMRSLLRNIATPKTEPATKSRKSNEATEVRVELYAVAAGNCDCPDRETHQIRLTYACLASVLGAADGVLPTPFEDTDESRRLAENVLLILRHEAGMATVQRVATGSYYLEQAASKIESGARDLLTRIVDAGGLKAAQSEGLLVPIDKADNRQSHAQS